MKTIKDHKLFQELVENPCWETLFDADSCLKNPHIPILSGGLDRISKTKKYFTFHDIGCNGRDNSFRIGDCIPIYALPCTYTGLDAEIDNCDPPATVVHVEHESMPMSDGCVERYRTADGYLVDCSIDSSDFADWFEEEVELA